MLGLSASISKAAASMRSYVKDNLKLYLDFKENKSNTLKFPCEGSTSFDGSNDYIQTGSNVGITGASSKSGCAWIYPTAVDDHGVIFDWGEAAAGKANQFKLFEESANTCKLRFDANGTNATGTTVFAVNTWYHVAFTYDGDKIRVYVNGVLEATSSSITCNSTDSPLIIGNGQPSNSQWFTGSIANIGIWSRVLSVEEINSIMRKNYSQLGSVEKTSLVGWWGLDIETGDQNSIGESDDKSVVLDLATGDGSESLGAELVPNNIITTDQFTLNDAYDSATGLGSTIENGVLRIRTLANDSQFIYDADLLDNGKIYRVEANVIDATGELYFRGGSAYTTNICGAVRTWVAYIKASGTNFTIARNASTTDISIDYLSIREVLSNHGFIKQAVVTTSVYGNNVPVLPRAVDVAKEGQADAIGNGSAFFTVADDDYIDLGNNSQLQILNALTITAWVNQTAISNSVETPIYSKGDQGSSRGVVLSIFRNDSSGGYSGFFGLSSNGTSYATQSSIPYGVIDNYIGEWIHISATYDGAGNTKIYLNGILQDSDSVTAFNINNSSQNAYIGFDGNTARTYSGSISQVGLWQGALTQAQIQSVMESTSYDKIPADVKSTLGSEELPSGDFKSNTGLTISQGSSGTLTHDQTAGTITATDDVQDGSIYWSGIIEDGKLYKATFVVDSCEGGRFRTLWGWTGNNFYPEVTSEQKTYVDYFVGGSSYAQFAIQFDAGDPCNFVLSNVSVKEVTNDIVGYWALDDDNSNTSNGAGITNDLTTGETLSSELVGDASFDSGGGTNITISNATDTEVTGGALEYTDGSASDVTFLKSSANILTSGSIYKVVFIIADTASHARLKFTFDENSGTGSSYSDHQNYANGTHTLYTVASQTNAVINISGASPSFKMTDISIKKVTSNTGVLK